ncbi:MAG: T9SS type A sorting domain-containing protein, partial [Candidatus Kapabacteria bacterium]|nr:T9SS type A sorting domain-containing protein [Candidatus Kapabacteria bacterium]
QDIPGATSNTYVIDPARRNDRGRYRCKVWNECGEVWSNEADIDIIPVSVSEAATQDGYLLRRITPMPTTGIITIHFATPGHAPTQLTLYDSYGRRIATVLDGTVVGEQTLILSLEPLSLTPGIYAIRLESAGVTLAQPFVYVR